MTRGIPSILHQAIKAGRIDDTPGTQAVNKALSRYWEDGIITPAAWAPVKAAIQASGLPEAVTRQLVDIAQAENDRRCLARMNRPWKEHGW